MKKKLSAFLIIGLVLHLVTGCGGETNPTKKGAPPPNPPAGPGKEQPKSPKPAD